MFRKIISSVTLAALLVNTIGLTGCSKTVKLSIDEVKVVPPMNISEVRQKSGDRIVFDASGGRYFHKVPIIIGVTQQGARARVSVADLDSIFYSLANDSTVHMRDAVTFSREQTAIQKDGIRGEIKGLLTKNGKVRFDSNYGRIDSTALAITGITRSGDTLTVPFDQIDTVQVKRFSTVKSVLLMTGVVFAALAIYVALTWEIDYEFDMSGFTYP